MSLDAPRNTDRWFDQFDVTDTLISEVMAAATLYGADDADLYFGRFHQYVSGPHG